MVTIKSYSDLEQSKKLAEILPLESADMCYGIDYDTLTFDELPWLTPYHTYTYKEHYVPCWSLAALLSVLNCPQLTQTSDGGWFIRTWYSRPYNISGVNPIDVCYEMIIRLHELKML